VIAVGIVVLSMVAAASGGAPAPRHVSRSHGFASLLTGDHAPRKHHLQTAAHSSSGREQPTQRSHPGSRGAGKLRYPVASAHDRSLAPKTQLIASLRHNTKGYPGRSAIAPNRLVPGSWYGHQTALPVLATAKDRLLVRLAQRPNGTTTWIKRDKAELLVTHWAIVVDLSRHFLYVFYNGVQQYAFPVGTGASSTPTPTGRFFVAFHSASNGPGYGPVNIATSAHSNVFRSFDGGDDAIIAIHGPIGSDAQIGNRGAAISNGCIRMHLGELAKVVRHVPDGAPVVLTY
jgi:lipoprotein-anchoring transpeptidase ErfK/SrfK